VEAADWGVGDDGDAMMARRTAAWAGKALDVFDHGDHAVLDQLQARQM
jgi:hypothetical protein